MIRKAPVCAVFECVRLRALTHAKLPVFVLVFLCVGVMWYFLCAGWCVSHSAECGRPFQGGRGDSFREEIQQRAVRRYDWALRTVFLPVIGPCDAKTATDPPPGSSGLIGSLFSLLQFLASPVTGALSDRHGRRPLLILTTVSEMTSIKCCCVTLLCLCREPDHRSRFCAALMWGLCVSSSG